MLETLYSLTLVACSLGMAALGALVWRRYGRESVARRYVQFAALVAVWLLLHASEIFSDQAGPRFFIAQLRWTFAVFIHVAYLAMALDFCGHPNWLKPRRFAPTLAISALIALLILSSHWHPWFVTDFRLVDAGFRTVPQFTRQIGFWIFQIYMSLMMILAASIMAGAMRQGTALFRSQVLLALVAWTIPNLANIFSQHVQEFVFGGVNLTPLSSVVFLPLTTWALFRHRLFDIKPVARAAVIESLSDAVMVFDLFRRLVDFNPAARRLLNLADPALGRGLAEVLAAWPAVIAAIANDAEGEVCLTTPPPHPRNLDCRFSPLRDRNSEFCGQVLVLRDVTEQKQAEERYRQLLESNPLGMTVVDNATGLIVYANQKALDLLEAPWDAVIGSAAVNYYANTADREQTTALFARQGFLSDYEVRLKSAKGRTAWCLMTSNPTVFDGKPCNVNSTVDISERREAEEALRFTQFVFDRMTDAAFWANASGQIVYVNDAACQTLGYSRAELLSLRIIDITPSYTQDYWDAHWLKLKQCLSRRIETQQQRKTGETFPVEVRTNFVAFEGQEFACGIARDISERKQAEAMAQAKVRTEAVARQQRAILEHLPVGVMVAAGPEHKILFQNPCFEQMFGYTIEEIPDAAHWWPVAYPDPDYRQSLQAKWGEWMARLGAGETELGALEVTVTTRDGSAKQVAMHISAMDDQLFVTCIDLTERLQAEQASRERDAAEAESLAKSRLLANISHELRTPLNAILGFAQVLERDLSLDATHREKLSTIHRSGEHLLALINDVLDMAKIEAGRLSLRLHTFDLPALIAEVEALFSQRAAERKLAWRVEAVGLPRFVNGDETRLRQVLINLLSNAVKFTRDGNVSLCVQALPTGGVRFSVADTGMGIAATEMGHLFEPFSQTASGLKVQEGTGLGLAISRQFVRLMGGDIQVASAPGQGTRFWFTLPLAEAEPAPSAATGQNALPVLGVAAGQPACRILIVDGQAEDRAPLLAWLSSLNPEPPVLEFREAADGHEAMALWARWQPHLILIDMELPGLPGKEVTRQIKAQMAANPDWVRTLVIAFSDGGTGEGCDNTPACGCDETVRKPFRAEELYAVLQRRAGVRLLHGPQLNPHPAALSERGLACHLAQCPAEWREALRTALDSGDFNNVNALVGQLSEQDPALHARLAKWAYDCDHEAMLRIFEDLP